MNLHGFMIFKGPEFIRNSSNSFIQLIFMHSNYALCKISVVEYFYMEVVIEKYFNRHNVEWPYQFARIYLWL